MDAFPTVRARAGAAAAAIVAASVLCGATAAGAADSWPPGGTADGVRIVQKGARSAIVFEQRANKLYRSIAGKRVTVTCTRGELTGSLESVTMGQASTDLRTSKQRRPQIGGLTHRAEYCRVWLPKHTLRRRSGRTTVSPRPVVAIGLTDRGVVHLDEEATAMTVFAVVSAAGFMADDAKKPSAPSPARVVAFFGRAGRPAPFEVVALANPTDTPPAGSVGYYSDGREHVAVAMLSSAGRRLFFEVLPDDELRTSVLSYINGYGDGVE